MRKQRGLSLLGLIFVSFLIVLAAVLAIKVGPAWVEYFTVLKNINAVVESGEAKGSVADIRRAYDRRAAIDDTPNVKGSDLEITKSGGEVVISFAYPRKIPLFGNTSLYFDFEGSTEPVQAGEQ